MNFHKSFLMTNLGKILSSFSQIFTNELLHYHVIIFFPFSFSFSLFSLCSNFQLFHHFFKEAKCYHCKGVYPPTLSNTSNFKSSKTNFSHYSKSFLNFPSFHYRVTQSLNCTQFSASSDCKDDYYQEHPSGK